MQRLESACGVRERENERTRERKKHSLRNYGLSKIHSSADPAVVFLSLSLLSFSLNLLHQSISSPLSLLLSLAPSLFLSRSPSLSFSLPLLSPSSPFLVPSLFLSRSPSLSLWFPLSFSLVSSLSLFVSRFLSFSHATNRLIQFSLQTRRLESACGVRERENERTRERQKNSV